MGEMGNMKPAAAVIAYIQKEHYTTTIKIIKRGR